jgi:lysosomal alpha-mannosidase
MDRIIKYVNKNNGVNITLQYSTPSEYLDALKADKVVWPTKYDDGFPYADNKEDFWTGFFSSRPTKKKMTKDASSNLHASQKLMAQKVISLNVQDSKVKEIKQVKQDFFDVMGVLQHHDAITGTEQQHVADDYTMTLAHSQFKSNKVYSQLLKEKMKQITGLSSDQVVTCPQNETVAACPQAKESLKSFVVIAHNQQAHSNKQFVRILLPSNKYTAMVWSKD